MIRSIFGYFCREKFTAFMLLFLVSIVGLNYLTLPREELRHRAHIAKAASTETKADYQEAGDRMWKELKKNGPALRRVSIFLALLFMAGFLIDVYYVAAAREGRLARFLTRAPIAAAWPVREVFRVFVFLFFSEVVLSVLMAFAIAFLGLRIGESTLLMLVTFLRNLATVIFVIFVVLRRYHRTLKDLGLKLDFFLENVGFGLGAYLGFLPLYAGLLFVIMALLQLAGYEPPLQQAVEIVYREQNTRVLFAMGLLIAILGPIFEEIFFRGFMYQAFRLRWGPVWAIIGVSILFALLHAHWVAIIPIFALSAVLCYVFEKTGSLVPGTVLHMTHNLIMLFVMFKIREFNA